MTIHARIRSYLKPINTDLDGYLWVLLLLIASIVSAFIISTSKQAQIPIGMTEQIDSVNRDLILKRLDFFSNEALTYFGIVLGLVGATFVRIVGFIRRREISILHAAAWLGVGIGFVFGFVQWGLLQSALQVTLTTKLFSQSCFQKLLGNIQWSLVVTAFPALFLFVAPTFEATGKESLD